MLMKQGENDASGSSDGLEKGVKEYVSQFVAIPVSSLLRSDSSFRILITITIIIIPLSRRSLIHSFLSFLQVKISN